MDCEYYYCILCWLCAESVDNTAIAVCSIPISDRGRTTCFECACVLHLYNFAIFIQWMNRKWCVSFESHVERHFDSIKYILHSIHQHRTNTNFILRKNEEKQETEKMKRCEEKYERQNHLRLNFKIGICEFATLQETMRCSQLIWMNIIE